MSPTQIAEEDLGETNGTNGVVTDCHSTGDIVGNVNRSLRGWANYFHYRNPRLVMSSLDELLESLGKPRSGADGLCSFLASLAVLILQ